MSYDIAINVKIEGLGKWIQVAEPHFCSPTYNLGTMFRKCMNWDFSQTEIDENGIYQTCYYPCDEVIKKVERGIKELKTKPQKYLRFEPANKWGTIRTAIDALESLKSCIERLNKDFEIPLMFMKW